MIPVRFIDNAYLLIHDNTGHLYVVYSFLFIEQFVYILFPIKCPSQRQCFVVLF